MIYTSFLKTSESRGSNPKNRNMNSGTKPFVLSIYIYNRLVSGSSMVDKINPRLDNLNSFELRKLNPQVYSKSLSERGV